MCRWPHPSRSRPSSSGGMFSGHTTWRVVGPPSWRPSAVRGRRRRSRNSPTIDASHADGRPIHRSARRCSTRTRPVTRRSSESRYSAPARPCPRGCEVYQVHHVGPRCAHPRRHPSCGRRCPPLDDHLRDVSRPVVGPVGPTSHILSGMIRQLVCPPPANARSTHVSVAHLSRRCVTRSPDGA